MRPNQEVDKKGGMDTDFDFELDPQNNLVNLNIAAKEWTDWDEPTKAGVRQSIESAAAANDEEWSFINTLS